MYPHSMSEIVTLLGQNLQLISSFQKLPPVKVNKLFHINLIFVVNGLSPKSNRSKIRVVSGFSVWIIRWFSICTSFFNIFEVLFTLFICKILLYIYKWILVINSTLLSWWASMWESRESQNSWRCEIKRNREGRRS